MFVRSVTCLCAFTSQMPLLLVVYWSSLTTATSRLLKMPVVSMHNPPRTNWKLVKTPFVKMAQSRLELVPVAETQPMPFPLLKNCH
jgi:hypothetical protein